ncbi:MAG: hypothetical protein BWZ10_02908 [candidate division BRC1 bacterium ADurb.BinA364]|nr:MAG: hypothetical protein BWZ10_02908 [candidate division BRC1 bacterium ADurb.BinA364]
MAADGGAKMILAQRPRENSAPSFVPTAARTAISSPLFTECTPRSIIYRTPSSYISALIGDWHSPASRPPIFRRYDELPSLSPTEQNRIRYSPDSCGNAIFVSASLNSLGLIASHCLLT